MRKEKMWVAGSWCASEDGRTFAVTDPATGEVVGEVPDATEADVRRAVEAAHQAFPEWAGLPARKRSDVLYAWYRRILDHQEDLARLLTREQGKPLAEARGEIAYAAQFVLWYAEEANRVYGYTVPASSPTKRIQVLRQPVGVVAAITPWNFPAAMVTRKVAPALAAGCTVVLKPAEQTPLTALALARLLEEAGLPAGVVNVVTGEPKRIGRVLLDDPRVRKITFTGSTEVGKYLMREAAAHVKRISLELGGHAPFLIFDDADLDAAVKGVVASKFRNAGQTCICANRILVQRSVYDAFVARFVDAVRALKVGHGLEDGVDIGPLVDEAAVEKVLGQVAEARAKGAEVLVGGYRLTEGAYGRGHFVAPTVLANVNETMAVWQEETFGPVAPVAVFDDEADAIAKANRSRYGLAAYVYTQGLSRAMRVAEQLEYGIVGVNDPVPSVAQAPFGGWKESGMGREGGREGIDAFLETKYVSFGI